MHNFNNKSAKVGAYQCIKSIDGYVILLSDCFDN